MENEKLHHCGSILSVLICFLRLTQLVFQVKIDQLRGRRPLHMQNHRLRTAAALRRAEHVRRGSRKRVLGGSALGSGSPDVSSFTARKDEYRAA